MTGCKGQKSQPEADHPENIRDGKVKIQKHFITFVF